MEGISQKLLIVERKLISNRGHHHTQIGALKSLFPRAEPYILAGEGYDGFLGGAVGAISAESFRFSRLNAKMKFGVLTERIAARVKIAFDRRLRLPRSAFGLKLLEVCAAYDFSSNDLVVIPTADIDSLESALEFSISRGNNCPVVALRFLSPTMGEKSEYLLKKRIQYCNERLPANVKLYTETAELALFLWERYGLKSIGGFLLPCSLEITAPAVTSERVGRCYRVGVFGAPRKEKGSERVASIVRGAANDIVGFGSDVIDFVVQGSVEDFSDKGVYRELRNFVNHKGVSVSAVSDRLSPEDFELLFKSTDVVLLPYDVNVYGLQGSGVIQDAVAALKPIAYSRGMAMSSLLVHGNAVAASSNDDFVKALQRISNERDDFAVGARYAREFLKHFENPVLRHAS